MNARIIPVLACAALLLAACTGVPTSSSPHVVNPINIARPGGRPAVTPDPNADPRSLVRDFLTANALVDEHHASARDFLTPDARSRWSDTTVTVLDATQVSNYSRGSVTVHGRKLGTVSASGIYTPVLQGDGGGGVSVPFTFGMKQLKNQWRIDTLPSGLILTYAEFQRIYQQRTIYFYDLAEKTLVADPRYSSLTDRSLLANWLVGQLAAGPRPELQNAVITELPAQTDPRTIAVILGSPVTVDVPRSGQLDVAHRALLVAQLAYTLEDVTRGTVMSILDGGRPITISSAGSTRYAATDPTVTPPQLFYIDSHAVVDDNGRALPGELGTGEDGLNSVALASRGGSRDLLVAGVSGSASDSRLLVGSVRTGLRPTSVRGTLSRPSWAPDLDEVWVGNGSRVYRVTHGGKPTEVPVAGAGPLTGRVRAMRFSPDGSRIAMVLSASGGGSAQVWVGLVVRNDAQQQVRVDSLEPISPQGVVVTDVAWNDELKLFTIGTVPGTHEGHVYEVQVDGSLWTARSGTEDLPGPPDSITVTENAPAWVSVDGSVWTQSGGSWVSPNNHPAFGTDPVYLE